MKNEITTACKMYDGEERCMHGFGGKRLLGRPRHGRKYINKLDLQEIVAGGLQTGLIWLRIGR
jgi:hypothetical protein